MRVHVVADVHGNVEALARAGDGADALVVLGDLIDFIDYADPTAGIVGRVLGEQASSTLARLRSAGDRDGFLAFSAQAWAGIDDPEAVVEDAIREQYATLFAVLPDRTYAIPGNVDVPDLWPEFAQAVCVPDGQVVTIEGLRFGFLGGAPLPPGAVRRTGTRWRPNVLDRDDYRARAARLVGVDVLCTHVPPEVPELCYDVVSRGPETSGPGLLEIVDRDRPRAALFGHVHQPLAARVRRGRTECVNVGYFRRHGTPYVLRW